MANTKHVGQIINTQRRCVVMFREVPGEPQNCLIIDTDSLPDWMHDDVINAVNSPGAQASANFYEYAQRTMFADGSNMLQALHTRGLLRKQPTSNIKMTPNASVAVRLDELNGIIAEQSGGKPAVAPPKDPNAMGMAGKKVNTGAAAPMAAPTGVISDDQIAQQMLSQAAQFEAEAKRLREEASALAPSQPKAKARSKKTSAVES
jgi:hypothetical protein